MAKVLALERVFVLVLSRMTVDTGDKLRPVATLLERLSHEVFWGVVELAKHGGWSGVLDGRFGGLAGGQRPRCFNPCDFDSR